MITVLILLIMLSIISVISAGISIYVGYRALKGFIAIDAQHEEYRRYLNIILDEVEESSLLFRAELARKLSLNMPETKELNNHLFQLETKMKSFKLALKDFLIEE